MKKKIVQCLAALALACGMVPSAAFASVGEGVSGDAAGSEVVADAGGAADAGIEMQAVIDGATPVTLNTTVTGSIGSTGNKYIYYKVTLPDSGLLTLSGVNTEHCSGSTGFIIKIYDENGTSLWSETFDHNSITDQALINWSINMLGGTYYIYTTSYYSEYYPKTNAQGDGTHSINFKFTSSEETYPESLNRSNNTLKTADKIEVGEKINGFLSSNDTKDFYEFTVDANINPTFIFQSYKKYQKIYFYDSDGKELLSYSTTDYYNSTKGEANISKKISLSPGTYYVCILANYNMSGNGYGFYNFLIDSPLYYDVSSSDWFYDAVSNMKKTGLITGYGNGYFGPYDTLTRAQAAVILCRCYAPDVAEETQVNTTGMTDVESKAWYTAAANWAVENGIINGKEINGRRYFAPNDPITREQLCVIIANTAAAFGGADLSSVSMKNLNRMPDVGSVDSWARTGVAWCLNSGVISGKEYGGVSYVSPLDNTDRSQMAQVMTNALKSGIIEQK